MTYDSDNAGRSRLSPTLDINEFDRTDRILLGACAGIWLVALGAGVAATVALVDMAQRHAETSGESSTPWLLYTIIAISAVVILAAVPLLLRARREAMADSGAESEPPRTAAPMRPAPPQRGVEAPTEKLSVAGATGRGFVEPRTPGLMTASSPATKAADQLWLRFALVIACAIGIAMIAIGVATYLMAIDSDIAAWAFYVLAGLVTAAMPAVPWYFLRELRTLAD